ncbi:MAG: hypothetical protein ACK4XK_05650 [Casimicrobiaceae bacterium]
MPEASARRPVLPVGFGLIRTTIPGARKLDADDLIRAAALVLVRDFGVRPYELRVAVRLTTAHQETGDDCLIAWTEHAEAADRTEGTEWLTLADGETVYWFDAPGGFAIGPGGLAELVAVEPRAPEARPDALPTALLMLIATSRGARELVLVSPSRLPDTRQLALWEAASGLTVRSIAEGELPPSQPVALRPPPPPAPPRTWSPIDRALAAVFAATLVLFGASLVPAVQTKSALRSANGSENPAAAADAVQNAPGSTAGLLLLRTLHAAPELATALTAAEYGDGRWVLMLRSGPPLARIERALALNGLAAQSLVQGEEVRLRVERRRP